MTNPMPDAAGGPREGEVEQAVFRGYAKYGVAIVSECVSCRKPYLKWAVVSTMTCDRCAERQRLARLANKMGDTNGLRTAATLQMEIVNLPLTPPAGEG